MFEKNKIIKTSLIIITLVIVSSMSFWLLTKKPQPEKPEENGTNQNGQEIKLKSQIVEEQVIASNGEGFPHFRLQPSGEEFIIATYPYTTSPDKSVEEGTGFFIFKYNNEGKLERVWKGSEFFYQGIVTFSEDNSLKDLDNDGIKELIIYLSDIKGKVFDLWIYKWRNERFNFITPKERIKDSDTDWSAFRSPEERNLQFLDMDNDGKTEVSLLYQDYVRLGPGVNDIRIDIYKRIYKWDGTEKPYYLWKEEKLGEEKPEEP